jgi:hypothetical protein
VVPDDAPLDGSAKSGAKGGAKAAGKAAAKGKGAPSADVVVAELAGKRKLTVGSFKGQARQRRSSANTPLSHVACVLTPALCSASAQPNVNIREARRQRPRTRSHAPMRPADSSFSAAHLRSFARSSVL